MTDEIEETRTCEACEAPVPLDDAVYSEDCYFCPACWAKCKAEFDACNHELDDEPHYDEHGDKGHFCIRCGAFVADEDFEHLFPVGAP